MKVGDIIESEGIKRRITSFTNIYGVDTPNTEIVEEMPQNEEKDIEEKAEYVCRYCGKVCKSELGLKAHELKCPNNPNRK